MKTISFQHLIFYSEIKNNHNICIKCKRFITNGIWEHHYEGEKHFRFTFQKFYCKGCFDYLFKGEEVEIISIETVRKRLQTRKDGRIPIPEKIRKQIWKRAKGRCEKCGASLIKLERTINKNVRILIWVNHLCWRRECQKISPIIQIELPYPIEEEVDRKKYPFLKRKRLDPLKDEIIGDYLASKYSFFKKGLSKKAGVYFANHCEACGGIQGDYYIKKWIFKQAHSEGIHNTSEVELLLPESRWFFSERKIRRYHDHHIDKDPTNNDPKNLLVICPKCHRSYHGRNNTGQFTK